MKLIVGLGNPGKNYENTRHNVGFMIVDEFAKKNNLNFDKSKFNSDYAVGFINNEKYLLVKPKTYMNLSGEAVRKFYDYFNLEIEDVLIIYDDLDTKTANFRLRNRGSSGGHNGIKSIMTHLNTDKFNRLKIGIDRPKEKISVINYVLGKFSKEELLEINKIYSKCNNCIEDFSNLSFTELMNKYN
ncbi:MULTISPECIES: aminoacyl-tRNA hydrolase [unclassified Gemella]|uniref:aminoacyl-tRNA hydrolase n=1 Tax=unclassified Gemella TaxID=2624949 RepID=UPI001C0528EA|nr:MULTISPECIES: aminoacyl-tRNA hydrolase [unclassified Gemella]MBU0278500.1 aminoacyl-tRNA hydrolase [Gemella sp. zg-1178]QWQ39461.1 aminoacyl-tRNA hydrolase [Gemella sp. zg-570]